MTDIGWLQFQLREIDSATQQPTGCVVTFSNSFFFCHRLRVCLSSRMDLKPAQLEVAVKAE